MRSLQQAIPSLTMMYLSAAHATSTEPHEQATTASGETCSVLVFTVKTATDLDEEQQKVTLE